MWGSGFDFRLRVLARVGRRALGLDGSEFERSGSRISGFRFGLLAQTKPQTLNPKS